MKMLQFQEMLEKTLELFSLQSDAISPRLYGLLSYYLQPELKNTFGGPFNGQQKRAEMISEILNRCKLKTIVETGTYLGNTTEYLSRTFNLPVYSTEIEEHFFTFAECRLRAHRNVKLSNLDSRKFLKKLSKDKSIPNKRTFFYLDAHWQNDLPLREELELIQTRYHESIVIIDDFKVPFDSGYGFDDYGKGKSLTCDILSGLKFKRYWPKASSRQETGWKRGAVILATNDRIINELKKVRSIQNDKKEASQRR